MDAADGTTMRLGSSGARQHGRGRGTRLGGPLLALVVVAATALVSLGAPAGGNAAIDSADPADGRSLHLVALDGPGLAGLRATRAGERARARRQMRADQDRSLAAAAPDGTGEVVHRWFTALNGYAVRLTDDEAARLAARPEVTSVEDDAVRPTAARGASSAAAAASPSVTPSGTRSGEGTAPGSASAARRGGAGVVVGIVDSGVDPTGLVLSDSADLGRRPSGFDGACVVGERWTDGDCGAKVVGARWFVAGFGVDRLASSASVSARDDSGHGTAVASVAAGNAGVPVTVGRRVGDFSGVAPQARVAAYKACWTAPDPADDGCATSDLVTAVDRATADRVDVMSLAVAGPSRPDLLDRALLGAAEADVVVVAAAGNDAGGAYAAHASPWALTVGSHTTPLPRGRLSLEGPDAVTLTGAMASMRTLDDLPVVVGSDAGRPGARSREAGLCRPGTLDSTRVTGAVVVCGRGGVSIQEKSLAVARAGGQAVVVTDQQGGELTTDLYDVPVLHVTAADGVRLRRSVTAAPRPPRARLQPAGRMRTEPRPSRWSATGDPRGPVVSPSLLAPGENVLGAAPPGPQSRGWRTSSGTSAATAVVAGAAARLRADRPDWSADRVRSALVTTAAPLAGVDALDQGSGRARPGRASRPGLVFETPVSDLRRALDDGSAVSRLNTPSAVVAGRSTVVRRVRNVSASALYFSSEATGFARHDVTVSPAALRLAPGETGEFRVEVGAATSPGAGDSGTVTWRGADGSRTVVPVVVTR